VTYRCHACEVNWWSYQCKKGCCPECGGGTVRDTQNSGSMDADARYKAAQERDRAATARKRAFEEFDRFAAEWDRAAMVAQADELAELPVVKPRRAA
jgi:hypothetical protein